MINFEESDFGCFIKETIDDKSIYSLVDFEEWKHEWIGEKFCLNPPDGAKNHLEGIKRIVELLKDNPVIFERI